MDLPDDVLDEYRSLFSYFDRDGGGTIGPDEIKQVMEAFHFATEDKLIKVRMLLVTHLYILVAHVFTIIMYQLIDLNAVFLGNDERH